MKRLECLSVVIFALLTIFANSCISMEPPLYGLYLDNKTEEDLYALCRWDTYYSNKYIKEDRLEEDSSLYKKVKIEVGYFHAFFEVDEEPEDYLKATDTITVFILSKEDYESKTWGQLVDTFCFRQIYHLSGDDIRLIGWKIPYPPTEKMRNMDMVPSYDETVKN